jgi:hydrogenase maturation protease
MVSPVLICAIGNESRGDDALGVKLLRELDAWLKAESRAEQFELLEEFQLQIEHAMDMKDRHLVLFVDAGINVAAPFLFYRAQQNDGPVLYSHALAPEALLKVYAQFYKEAPPDVYILCIRGESFELGEGLSPQADENLEAALEFGKKLAKQPQRQIWDNYCVQKPMEDFMRREDNHPA